jgi:hypothetical protein
MTKPESRIFRALPETDEDLGEIRWDRPEPLPWILCTKGGLTNACRTCAFQGPLNGMWGRTLHAAEVRTYRKITQKSKVAEGQRLKSVPVRQEIPERWLISHHAVRCPACEETHVFIMGSYLMAPEKCEPDDGAVWPKHDWKTRTAAPDACIRCGYPRRPDPGTLYEITGWYQPPRTERVPPKDPDTDTLF